MESTRSKNTPRKMLQHHSCTILFMTWSLFGGSVSGALCAIIPPRSKKVIHSLQDGDYTSNSQTEYKYQGFDETER